VVNAFEDGATPKAIVQRFATLRLSDVCAVITYDLRHRGEIDEYLRRRDRQAAEMRQRIDEAQRDLIEIRRRLLARRTPTEPNHAAAGQ
jgi:hypothetical protein